MTICLILAIPIALVFGFIYGYAVALGDVLGGVEDAD